MKQFPVPGMAAVAALTLAVLAGGCASTGNGDGDDPSATQRNAITFEQLQETPDATAMQLVRRLQPIWLRTRGQQTFRGSSGVNVVVDGTVRGDVSVLDSYRAGDLEVIRYMDQREAVLKYGTRVSGPVIELQTRGG